MADGNSEQSGPPEDAALDDVMRKYDLESNVRVWEGWPKVVIRYIMTAFSLHCIFVTLFSTALPEVRLTMFVGFVIIMGYLNYPFNRHHVRVNSMPWYDILIMLAGSFSFFYFAANAVDIIRVATRITRDPFMVVLAIVGILSLMELCRRCVGIPILCVVTALLAYTFSTVRFGKVIYDLFYTTTGVLNTPVNVCAKFIVVFIIFGAFLERTGISAFFIQLANAIAGTSAGGPAKVAVISSALCGMVSGSSVGNTVTTGSVTIPMMQKTGYKPEFAGAVEAAASTGGQIMPPIMGAAAFLMAEYMGVPYSQVALKAILPAVLYFIGIYIAVHLEARKLGLRGMSREDLPKLTNIAGSIYLLTPLVLLVYLVSTNTFTMQLSATIAIGVTIAVGLIKRQDRLTLSKVIDAFEAGGKGTVTVAVACCMAGIVAGCITATGLASRLITIIVDISGDWSIIALLLTMVCCIILGMGVPTTANYCIMAATCAPILMSPDIGIARVSAHFFVFYFGIVADITPPVALAAYAGAAIAKAPPMRTAFNASRLAIAAFVVPYVLAYKPAMLFEGVESWYEVAAICYTAVLGIIGIAAALNGFLFKPMHPVMRVIFAALGIVLLAREDLVWTLLFFAVIYFQYAYPKKPEKTKIVPEKEGAPAAHKTGGTRKRSATKTVRKNSRMTKSGRIIHKVSVVRTRKNSESTDTDEKPDA